MSNTEAGKRLKEWIKKSGRTQKSLALELGMQAAQISQYVTGVYGLGAMFQRRLRELGADVDYIVTGRKANEQTEKGELLSTLVFAKSEKIRNIVTEITDENDTLTVCIYAAKVRVNSSPKDYSLLPIAAEHEIDYVTHHYIETQKEGGEIPRSKAAATPIYNIKPLEDQEE